MQQIPLYTDGARRIALLQPGSWGDNINSTLMFKPLKTKWPDCIIDVYTSTTYGSAFHNNPYISYLHETPSNSKQEALHQLITIRPMLDNRGYFKIFCPHPMINPDKWASTKNDLGTNLICAWVRALEDENIDYELPLETILKLTDQEIEKANRFLSQIPNNERKKNLVENGPESGQSHATPEFMSNLMLHLCAKNEIVIASRKHNGPDFDSIKSKYPNSFFFADLSIRECAEIFNHCQRYIGLSSGLNNACGTNWCKKDIEWIEIVNSMAASSAPIRSENKTFFTDSDLHKVLSLL